jgi:hypothetical protein
LPRHVALAIGPGHHCDVLPIPKRDNGTVGNIQRAMERSGFEIADVESPRPHYALTLRRWVVQLERHHAPALSRLRRYAACDRLVTDKF